MDRKEFLFLTIVLSLFVCGLLMVFNTTAAEILDLSMEKDLHYALIRQILYAFLGAVIAVGVWTLGASSLLRLSGPLLCFFSFLLICVFIPKIGVQINGAHRWISIFGNSFQPSECVKYLIPMYYIRFFMKNKCELSLKQFICLMFLFSVPLSLILIEPDNGTVFIIGCSLIVLFVITSVRLAYWLLPFLIASSVIVTVASRMDHVPDRIRIFLHPETDLLGKGHQPYQAKIAAGSGGIFGKGLGESFQKMTYLPEARSDYIAAIFAEEFGFIGICLMILFYVSLIFIGYLMAISCQREELFYIISIFIFLICFQAFLNLGVVSGLLPSKGVNLPFFSQGGSSLLSNFIGVGIILSAYREGKKIDA